MSSLSDISSLNSSFNNSLNSSLNNNNNLIQVIDDIDDDKSHLYTPQAPHTPSIPTSNVTSNNFPLNSTPDIVATVSTPVTTSVITQVTTPPASLSLSDLLSQTPLPHSTLSSRTLNPSQLLSLPKPLHPAVLEHLSYRQTNANDDDDNDTVISIFKDHPIQVSKRKSYEDRSVRG